MGKYNGQHSDTIVQVVATLIRCGHKIPKHIDLVWRPYSFSVRVSDIRVVDIRSRSRINRTRDNRVAIHNQNVKRLLK